MGALTIPIMGKPTSLFGALTAVPNGDKRKLADAALNAATAKGATYADVRIGRYLNQFVITRENKVQNIVNTESYGAGVRVIANGTWGFAATNQVTQDAIAKAAEQAVAIAKANAALQTEPVQLAPVKGHGEVTWKTPIEKNAFEVPISEKVDLLMSVNDAAMKNGANFVNSFLFLVNEQKYYASTDGSYIDQDVHRIWPNFVVTAIDPQKGKFQTRDALSAPMGMGWEYLSARPESKVAGVTTRYGKHYDMLEDATAAAKQAKEKHSAKTVEAGKYDLVLDPSHLWLTIHESVGHPLELDRVLGYEANYAGTSFATLDKWKSKSFNYGSKLVQLFADKTQTGSLGAVGYDDEGVKCKRWDLVKDGILVNYQAIRDQVHMLGENESHGCCYADNWSSVQFQRMPNVSLAAGKEKLSVEDMIKGVEKGIYIIGDGSYSIDQQRYNFQFGGQLFYEIKNGKIAGMLRDVAYQSNTQEFWNSCVAICDESDYRLGGSFFDGKGEPGQISAVSHGCATSRFNGVNVINTERKI
ncbi:TldD/PmbA family protein [candidate division KSB1 bacterium]|nr:MAG: TldD/PmbA family protein [candidate division KSB1 bacterium]MCE7943351.1 TldD/PmbA family protein [Chlorobi bacterium CHB1]MDL1874518.1 TldD/PmbA family protein [Cytophagia bacterium CHB2]